MTPEPATLELLAAINAENVRALQSNQNLITKLDAQLATLRALWRTAPSGWRESVRTYHAEYYAEWCQALGVEA